MVLQGTAIVNLMIEVMGIMICIFGLIMIRHGGINIAKTRRYMYAATINMMLYHICLLYVELFQATPGMYWRPGAYIAGLGSFLYSILALVAISLYMTFMISPEDRRFRSLRAAEVVLTAAVFASLLAAQFAGRLVHVDEEWRYSEGPGGIVAYICVVVFLVIDIGILLLKGEKVPLNLKSEIVCVLVLPMAAIFLRVFMPGVYIVAFASSLTMLLFIIVIVVENTKRLREERTRNEQLKIDLMLGQIQPHFLFNVLYVIQEICHIDAELASKAIMEFSKYLRHNMDSITVSSPIPFEEELEHVKHYVSLQQLRFGDALDVRYELGCRNFQMPTLTLQPLVENAIRYGVRKNNAGEGMVLIRTTEYADRFEVDVIDDGPGFVPDSLPDDGRSHMGLRNVQERLQRICGGRLKVESAPGKGTRATMILPK